MKPKCAHGPALRETRTVPVSDRLSGQLRVGTGAAKAAAIADRITAHHLTGHACAFEEGRFPDGQKVRHAKADKVYLADEFEIIRDGQGYVIISRHVWVDGVLQTLPPGTGLAEAFPDIFDAAPEDRKRQMRFSFTARRVTRREVLEAIIRGVAWPDIAEDLLAAIKRG